MTSTFTDASDEKQVMQRATDIYNTYINIDTMPDTYRRPYTYTWRSKLSGGRFIKHSEKIRIK